jgi:hypothetical protein
MCSFLSVWNWQLCSINIYIYILYLQKKHFVCVFNWKEFNNTWYAVSLSWDDSSNPYSLSNTAETWALASVLPSSHIALTAMARPNKHPCLKISQKTCCWIPWTWLCKQYWDKISWYILLCTWVLSEKLRTLFINDSEPWCIQICLFYFFTY